ncbi:MAG: UbiD family decarboxylase [Candidatus Heimdallarchaeota archaeon]|nr:UbiD family decarboxylase [Candidatus Heimdallarchaeota archaeon]
MHFREYIEKLDKNSSITKIKKEVSIDIEAAAVLKTAEPTPLLFENVKGYPNFRVAGNVFCTKTSIADYFGITTSQLIPRLTEAIDKRSPPEVITNAPCQEVVMNGVNLDKLPILKHNESDGGRYISSAVVVTKDSEFGQNLDFHRAMQFSANRMSTRIIKGRDFYKFLEKNGEVDAAYCVGNTPNVLVAAATSVKTGINELEIANALSPMEVTKATTLDLIIPAGCEFVLEGRVFMNDRSNEGPFIDLTETYDIVREEPVFEVRRITHRKNPIWQALLPGALEHKVLMGMPREPTIYKAVNEAGVKCLDVNVNPGGSSWLHAIVKIDKQNEDDGKKAIHAAFQGHRSCKHVFVVDKDINIYDPLEVEWSMATRFQAESGLVDIGKEPGSSLDPSAEPGTKITNKVGFDFTAPLVTKGKGFAKAEFPKVDLRDYIE